MVPANNRYLKTVGTILLVFLTGHDIFNNNNNMADKNIFSNVDF